MVDTSRDSVHSSLYPSVFAQEADNSKYKLKIASSEIEELKSALKYVEIKLAKSTTMNDAANFKAQEAEDLAKATQLENESLLEQNADMQKLITELRREKTRIEKECQSLKNQSQNTVQDLQSQLQQYAFELDRLRTTIKHKDSAISNVASTLAQAKLTNDRLVTDLEVIKQELGRKSASRSSTATPTPGGLDVKRGRSSNSQHLTPVPRQTSLPMKKARSRSRSKSANRSQAILEKAVGVIKYILQLSSSFENDFYKYKQEFEQAQKAAKEPQEILANESWLLNSIEKSLLQFNERAINAFNGSKIV